MHLLGTGHTKLLATALKRFDTIFWSAQATESHYRVHELGEREPAA